MSRLCRLDEVAGRERVCGEERCPFWEPGGAVLQGRCVLEHIDLAGRRGVASELLLLRDALDAAELGEADLRVEHEYHRLLNEAGQE